MPTSRRKPPALRNLKSYYVEGDELREPVWIQIRTILMEHWDPIGISDEPNAADEYDLYIPKPRP